MRLCLPCSHAQAGAEAGSRRGAGAAAPAADPPGRRHVPGGCAYCLFPCICLSAVTMIMFSCSRARQVCGKGSLQGHAAFLTCKASSRWCCRMSGGVCDAGRCMQLAAPASQCSPDLLERHVTLAFASRRVPGVQAGASARSGGGPRRCFCLPTHPVASESIIPCIACAQRRPTPTHAH